MLFQVCYIGPKRKRTRRETRRILEKEMERNLEDNDKNVHMEPGTEAEGEHQTGPRSLTGGTRV